MNAIHELARNGVPEPIDRLDCSQPGNEFLFFASTDDRRQWLDAHRHRYSYVLDWIDASGPALHVVVELVRGGQGLWVRAIDEGDWGWDSGDMSVGISPAGWLHDDCPLGDPSDVGEPEERIVCQYRTADQPDVIVTLMTVTCPCGQILDFQNSDWDPPAEAFGDESGIR